MRGGVSGRPRRRWLPGRRYRQGRSAAGCSCALRVNEILPVVCWSGRGFTRVNGEGHPRHNTAHFESLFAEDGQTTSLQHSPVCTVEERLRPQSHGGCPNLTSVYGERRAREKNFEVESGRRSAGCGPFFCAARRFDCRRDRRFGDSTRINTAQQAHCPQGGPGAKSTAIFRQFSIRA